MIESNNLYLDLDLSKKYMIVVKSSYLKDKVKYLYSGLRLKKIMSNEMCIVNKGVRL